MPHAQPHFGINLLGQHATWAELRDAVMHVDGLGFDSVWTWDQFAPFTGTRSGPMFEAWQLLAALGAATSRVHLSTLVTCVTYRHPAVLAKIVATLDQVTGGRVILGLGSGFNEAEHAMYGIPFPPLGERVRLLEEACEAIRLLFERPVATFEGRYVKLKDAVCEPKPVQARLPMLIAGRGEQKTLRIAARFADYWHFPPGAVAPGATVRPVEDFQRKLEILRGYCAELGRDPDEIAPIMTISPMVVLRDTEAKVRARWNEVAMRAGMSNAPASNPIHTAEGLVEELLDRWRLGARGFLFYVNMPFDLETVTRIAREVRPRFEQALAAQADVR